MTEKEVMLMSEINTMFAFHTSHARKYRRAHTYGHTHTHTRAQFLFCSLSICPIGEIVHRGSVTSVWIHTLKCFEAKKKFLSSLLQRR